MKNDKMMAAILAAACASLAACGSVDVWPFRGGKSAERSLAPANATEYRCSGGRSFHLRSLDSGAIWAILPDRQIRLDKVSDARYASGAVVLQFNGAEATLADGSSNAYSACKAVEK